MPVAGLPYGLRTSTRINKAYTEFLSFWASIAAGDRRRLFFNRRVATRLQPKNDRVTEAAAACMHPELAKSLKLINGEIHSILRFAPFFY